MITVYDLLDFEEGFFRKPTNDTEGKLTIGKGRNLIARPFSREERLRFRLPARDWNREPMTEDEANWLLARDVPPSIVDVRGIFGPDTLVVLGDVRRIVLESMNYQLGPGRWKTATQNGRGFRGFGDMISALKRGDMVTAHAEALDSKWAREDTPERAQRHARALLTGAPAPEWMRRRAA